MSPRLPLRVPLAAALVALALTALSGCFANPFEEAVNRGIEGAIEQATGGDVSLGGELPESWPAEIPVVDGEIVFGVALSEGDSAGWTVTIVSDAADPIAEAGARLEAAGFQRDTTVDGSAGQAGQPGLVLFQNDRYGVMVAGSQEGIIYTVTPIAP